ncbi:hypothetical protein L1049_028052 [Liquidambar formosana]|uniref:Helicase C-terminal domain-containing protein n=1 Tax=Liquidambar formosana TaxID=63359 RepID=A0AAP0WVU8_LIQFO
MKVLYSSFAQLFCNFHGQQNWSVGYPFVCLLISILEFICEKAFGSVRIEGNSLPRDRQLAVLSFQSSAEVKIAIVGIEAGGVGLDFSAAQNVVFLELPKTPSWMLQAEDRAHRRGQTSAVNIYIYCAKDTLDESHWQNLNKSLHLVSFTTDGKYDAVQEIAGSFAFYPPIDIGQGECRLENMRTLCVACLLDVTAAQCAERRSARAKAKKQLKVIISNLKNGQNMEGNDANLMDEGHLEIEENLVEDELLIKVPGSAYSGGFNYEIDRFPLRYRYIFNSRTYYNEVDFRD